jgi:hypothetical protein
VSANFRAKSVVAEKKCQRHMAPIFQSRDGETCDGDYLVYLAYHSWAIGCSKARVDVDCHSTSYSSASATYIDIRKIQDARYRAIVFEGTTTMVQTRLHIFFVGLVQVFSWAGYYASGRSPAEKALTDETIGPR